MSVTTQGRSGEEPGKARKPTIVVVDDCEVTLAATAETLERAGYRVLTRDRPAGCVAMMLQEKPDLVLLDVCMPTVAGDTLVKLFSKASPNSGTIILLYSALDEPLLRSKAKGSGAHGYISKTSDNAALVRAVRRHLRPGGIEGRVAVPSETDPLNRRGSANASAVRRATSVSPSNHSPSQLPPTPASGSSASWPQLSAAQISAAQSSASKLSSGSTAQRRAAEPGVSRLRDVALRTTASGEMRRASGSYPLTIPTVLFVDDDMLALSGYRRQLQGQPFEFDFALSVAQAVRLLESANPPSVIVSDLLMPEPSGRELLRKALDRDPSWSRRFVIVTGMSLHEARSQIDPRFTGTLLRKPVSADTLSAAIRGSLSMLGLPAVAESAR
jgi:two-component system, OmpR family, response regulator